MKKAPAEHLKIEIQSIRWPIISWSTILLTRRTPGALQLSKRSETIYTFELRRFLLSALNLVDLDHPDTRRFMLEEIEFDINRGALYISKRLSASGVQAYPELLRTAARNGTDSSFASALRAGGCMNSTEEKRKPKGGITIAKVPVTAADTLAEGEFNRFYVRALCRRAIAEGLASVVAYRAKDVEHPRPESEALVGVALPAQQLLQDLRQSDGTDTAFGLPPGPNSGLSVRLVRLARSAVQNRQ